ncbi:histidine triad (hit) protein [Lucifera butyrica]|uniref:Histidine triad (Hit) protein n=1 Tax=Lucifera butyrica TaxID=1351585 RepID=A0A498R7F1_9FIRM|nr:histidine triad nucleotide-binding protein [Lucifera butyrica]VBB06093.1 histidine triad (hit) protein [Lucifera butyrica]
MPADCIFCKIAAGEIPAEVIYQDDYIMAFPDISPVAPVHILVITKKHIANLLETTAADHTLLGHVMATLPRIVSLMGLEKDGFRVVVNTKEHGGQTVPHLHWHILGGRPMNWPPG